MSTPNSPAHTLHRGLDIAEAYLGLDRLEVALKANRERALLQIQKLGQAQGYVPFTPELILKEIAETGTDLWQKLGGAS